jgi:Zn-finger nucleic acid-binding protein
MIWSLRCLEPAHRIAGHPTAAGAELRSTAATGRRELLHNRATTRWRTARMSRCPSCADQTLGPIHLGNSDLPALGCEGCGGALLSLIGYRDWRDRTGADAVDAASGTVAVPEVNDTQSALRCPKCSGFMTKYRFSSEARNQIDLCDHCDEVWLDHGEWELLGRFALSSRLATIFTRPWQNRLRSEEARQRAEIRWQATLGDDYPRARELRSWLAGHPKGKELLGYLYLSQTEKT